MGRGFPAGFVLPHRLTNDAAFLPGGAAPPWGRGDREACTMRDRDPFEVYNNSLVPMVVEQTARGERAFDI